jgi:predicted DNA-binding protein
MAKEKLREQVCCRLPDDLLYRIKLEAVRTERSVRAVVVEAIEASLPAKMEVVVSQEKTRRVTSG